MAKARAGRDRDEQRAHVAVVGDELGVELLDRASVGVGLGPREREAEPLAHEAPLRLLAVDDPRRELARAGEWTIDIGTDDIEVNGLPPAPEGTELGRIDVIVRLRKARG